MTERSEALAAWEFCAWCWRSLGETFVTYQGRRYCSERCAGHDAEVALDPSGGDRVLVSDDQLELGDPA